MKKQYETGSMEHLNYVLEYVLQKWTALMMKKYGLPHPSTCHHREYLVSERPKLSLVPTTMTVQPQEPPKATLFRKEKFVFGTGSYLWIWVKVRR